MDTDSLYLALPEENLYDCIQPDRRAAWEKMRENECRDSFKADAESNFFPRTCCKTHKNVFLLIVSNKKVFLLIFDFFFIKILQAYLIKFQFNCFSTKKCKLFFLQDAKKNTL